MLMKTPRCSPRNLCLIYAPDGQGLGYVDGVGAICDLWAWAVSRVQTLSRMCFNGGVAPTLLCVKDAKPWAVGGVSMFHLQSAL